MYMAGLTHTHAFQSYLGSRGLFGRLLVRSLVSVPPDGRSGPEPGLTRLKKKKKSASKQNILFRTFSDEEATSLQTQAQIRGVVDQNQSLCSIIIYVHYRIRNNCTISNIKLRLSIQQNCTNYPHPCFCISSSSPYIGTLKDISSILVVNHNKRLYYLDIS